MNRILSPKQAITIARQLRKRQEKIILTGGCFDIIHIGHISLLEGAKKYKGSVMVFLESDEMIHARKGPNRPIHTQLQRAKILSALSAVDYVILLPAHMDNQDYDNLTKSIQPAIIATTKNDPGLVHKKRQAKEIGAKIVFANQPIHGISTSKVVSLLANEL